MKSSAARYGESRPSDWKGRDWKKGHAARPPLLASPLVFLPLSTFIDLDSKIGNADAGEIDHRFSSAGISDVVRD
jgi:hypothetical protein